MSVLSKEEFMNLLKERVGESTEDADIKFLEDMTDTYNDLEGKSIPAPDGKNWKSMYEESEKTWKAKYEEQVNRYKERFFSSGKEPGTEPPLSETEVNNEYEPDPSAIKMEDSYLSDASKAPEGSIVIGANML